MADYPSPRTSPDAEDPSSSTQPAPNTTTTNLSSTTTTTPPPVSASRLEEITTQACQTTLKDVTEYQHAQCASWNGAIIHSILDGLIKEVGATPTTTTPKGGAYKFVVNSTIVQHAGNEGGRRGMHSATAGYWNLERDGMWNFKFDGSRADGGLGMDVVVCVIWVAVA